MSLKRKRNVKTSPDSEVAETKNLEINTGSCTHGKYECTFTWKIGNINCQSIRSPTFTSLITDNKKVDWCLSLNRKTDFYRIHLEILSSVSCLRTKELNIESYIIDKNNTRRNFEKTELRPAYKNILVKGVSINSIPHGNENKDFLKKESLTIICKLDYREDFSLSLSTYDRLKEFDNFENLINSDKYSDVELIVERKIIRAHKNILSMRSSVFSAMFENNMNEEQDNLIPINDITYNAMKEVLRYIYAGKVDNINEDLAKDLLIAADKYKIGGLKSLCEGVLIDSMDIKNIGTLLLLADHYNLDLLKYHLFDFLSYNTVDIDSPSFELVLKALSSTMIANVRSALKRREFID